MSEDDKIKPTENADPKPESEADPHQSLDDLTVLNDVAPQTLGQSSLNVVRQVDGSTSGLGNLAAIQEGGVFTPLAAQRAQVNLPPDVIGDAVASGGVTGGDASTSSGGNGPVTGGTTASGATGQGAALGGQVGAALANQGQAAHVVQQLDAEGRLVTVNQPGAPQVALGSASGLPGNAGGGSVATAGGVPIATGTQRLATTETAAVEADVISTKVSGATSGTAQTAITGTFEASDNHNLTVHTTGSALNGSVSISSNGTYTYISNSGFVGSDTITFTSTDSLGTRVITTLGVSVQDSLSQSETGGAGTAQHAISGSWGVSDAAGLTVVPRAIAAHGTVSMSPNGTYTYVSNSGFVGTDTITFTATDASHVTHVNTAQVVVSDALSQTESNGAGAAQRATTGTWSVSDAAGISETPVGTAGHGTVSIGADGSYAYTSASGFVGTDTITFTTTDASGAAHVNTAQVVVTDTLSQAESGGAGTAQRAITGTWSVSDAAGISETPVGTAGHGTVSIGADGSYAYTSASGFVGTDTITFTTTDASGVAHVNTAQVVVTDALSQTESGEAGTAQRAITGTWSVSDAAGVSEIPVGTAGHGTVSIGADGSYTYTSASGFVGTDTITFTATDASHVTHVNTAQVVVSDALSQSESGASTISEKAVTGTWSVSDAAGVSETPVATAGHGTVSIGADGSYAYTSASGFVGTDTITFTTTDASGVAHVNTAAVTVGADTLSQTDVGGAATAQNALTGSWGVSDAAGISVTPTASAGHGTVSIGADGSYTYTSASGFVGTDTITFAATDASGVSHVNTAQVVVTDALSQTESGGAGLAQQAITGTWSVSDAAGISETPVASANNGTVSIGADGSYTYTSVSGFVGTDTITFTTTDASGVAHVNTATVMVEDQLTQTETGGSTVSMKTVTGSWTVTDGAGFALEPTATANHGTVSVNADGTYTYTSDSGYVGTDTITFTTTDAAGIDHVNTATVTVGADSLSQTDTGASALARQAVTGSWSVTDAAGLTLTPTATAGHGTVSVGADGSYSYTSASGFVGTDTITFAATDASGVSHVNTAQVVVTDALSTSASNAHGSLATSYTGTIGASDAAGLATTTTGAAGHGTVSVGADGSYSYTAASGFVGTDTITFTTTDGAGGQTSVVTAHVTVADTLTSSAANGQVNSGVSYSGQLVVSDTAGLATATTATAANGTVSLAADGSYSYVSNSGFIGTDTITFSTTDAHGVSSTTTATVTVIDPNALFTHGATIATAPESTNILENQSASFSLAVTDGFANESVTAVTITGAPAGSTVSVGGVTIAQNIDNSFTLTPAQAANASLSITPPADYSGTMTLTVNATADASGLPAVTNTHVISVDVTPVTQGATITAPATVADTENHTATFSLNVADTHTNESVSTVTITGAPAGATLTVDGVTIAQNSDHSFTLTPNQASSASLAITPPTDYSGTMTLTVSATAEESGASAVTHTQTIAVDVTPVTQGAAITAPSVVSDIQGQATTFSLGVSDTHLNESVTGVTITGAPSGTTLVVDGTTITQNSDHSFTLTPAQAASADVTITPPSSYTGSTLALTINATATESGASAVTHSQTLTLDITPVATSGATIATPSAVSTTENSAAGFTLNVGDYTTDVANGGGITNVSITGAPSGSTLTVDGIAVPQAADGSFTLTPDQATSASLSLTPPADYTGTVTLTVNATTDDGTGVLTTNTQTTTLTVTPETQGATISAPTTVSGAENYASSFTISVSDTHLNEAVNGVTITGAPTGSTLTVDGQTIVQNADGSFTLTPAQAADGNLSITPPTDYSGTMHLSVNATATEIGASATTTSQVITINVAGETQGATITAPTTVTGAENSASSISLSVSDTHLGESVTGVQIYGAPTGSTLTVDGVAVSANADGSFSLTPAQAASGTLSITPPTDYSGTITLQVDATAQNGTATAATTVQTISVDVAPVTQGATISAPTSVTGTENAAASISLNVSDTHLNESVTGVTVSGAPAGSTLTVAGETITANADGSFTLTADQASNSSLQLTPPTDFTGTVTLTVAATADATGAAPATVTQTITVDVQGVTQGATITAPQALGGIANTATPFTLGVSDGHLGEAVTSVTITGAPTGTTLTVNGQTIAQNADGSFTLTPDQAAHSGLAITPPADYTGTMNLTVNATADLPGASAVTTSQGISLTVSAGAATGATIAGPSTVTASENHSATFNLNVVDTHAGESVTGVTISGAPSGSTLTVGGQTLTADGSGVFHLTPAQAGNASLTITPPSDYSGTMSLSVTATSVDGSGNVVTNVSPMTVEVSAVTQGATVSAASAVELNENASVHLPISVADSHTGETVTGVTITGAPAGSILTVGGQTVAADGSGTFHLTAAQANDSSLTITPPTDYAGTATLHVNVTAENGTAAAVTTTQSMTMTVDPVTQGATVTAPTSAVTTTENHSASFPITVADTHTGESITGVTISGAPPGSSLTVGGHTYLPDSTGVFTLTPSQAASASLTMNPPRDFSGPIVLEIDATAQNGTAAPATVSQTFEVDVTGVTQGATIVAPATVTDSENKAAAISLQVSDAHTGEAVTAVTITGAPAGSTLTVGGVTIAQNADHSFTLTPQQAASAQLSLSPPTDYAGTMTLTVNATADLAGAPSTVATQNITVSVAAVTQGAAITAPQSVGMFTGKTASFSLGVSDTHTGESLSSVTITGAPSGSVLKVGSTTLTADSSGAFHLTPAQAASASLSVTPPSTYYGTFSLHVNAVAANGGAAAVTTSQAINFDVTNTTSTRHHWGSSYGPKIAPLSGTLSDTENHSTSFVLNTTDTNSYASVKSVTISGAPSGTTIVVDGITLTANSSGVFTVPAGHYVNGNIQITPPTGYYGTMTLTVGATDTYNYSTTQTVTMNVAQVGQGATISTTPNSLTTTPNTASTISLHVTDTHAGESLSSITISGAPVGSTLSIAGQTVTANAAGVFTLTSAQVTAAQSAGGDSLVITPPANYTGIMYVQVNATVLTSAGTTETNTQVVPVNVSQPTIGATITAPSTVTAAENHWTSFSLNVADTHLGETVTGVTITGAPSGTYLTVDGHIIHSMNGTFTLTAAQASDASMTIHPPHDYTGTIDLQVNATAVNGSGVSETNSQTIAVDVTGVSQGAHITVPAVVHGKEDGATFLNVGVQDTHHTESISYGTIAGAPMGSVLMVGNVAVAQNVDGSFTLTPTQLASGEITLAAPTGYVGDVNLTVSATSQSGTADPITVTRNVTLVVEDVGPTAAHAQSFATNVGESISENVGATGALGNTLSYALSSSNGPDHGTVTIDQAGDFTYTANSGFTGTDQFQIVVSDGHGGTVIQTESVLVQNPFNQEHNDGFHNSREHWDDGDASHYFRSSGDANAHISAGDGNYAIYGNDGSDADGSHQVTSQLHIQAATPDQAFGGTLSYSLGNLPDHCSVVDANGTVLDAAHLTDAQVNAGVYLSFPDTHVAASFDLAVTCTSTLPNGLSSQSTNSMFVDTSFMGGSDNISVGDGNNTIYGGAGDNVITGGDGNNTVTVMDGDNTITLGSGTDTVVAGDGNNSITLGEGSISLGHGDNVVTFTGGGQADGYALTGTVSLGGGDNLINITGSGANENVSILDSSLSVGAETLTLHHSGMGDGGDTMLFDFSGHSLVLTGESGGSWTDTLDLSNHTLAGTSLSIVDATGNTVTIDANTHGTLTLTGQSGNLSGTGQVFTDTAHQHVAVEFHNIEKIIY